MSPTKIFIGITAPNKKPTLDHRPAVWECLLGTVYAMNDAYETRYFDYDHQAALEFAGVNEEDRDPRIAKHTRWCRWADRPTDNPRPNQTVLWVRKRLTIVKVTMSKATSAPKGNWIKYHFLGGAVVKVVYHPEFQQSLPEGPCSPEQQQAIFDYMKRGA